MPWTQKPPNIFFDTEGKSQKEEGQASQQEERERERERERARTTQRDKK
jgi:hypothetical protein